MNSENVSYSKRETYKAYTMFKTEKITHKIILWEESRGRFLERTSLVWYNIPILVPYGPPSEMYLCSIIDIEYEIKVDLYLLYQCTI